MKQILNTIKIISIFFITIGFLNCEEDQVYFPKAFAEFTYTINHETGVVKFINTSRNASIYTWTFGDGQTSTEINPSHIYQPGTYTVSLVSKNIAGSFRTYQDVIVVGEKDDNGGGIPSDCTAEVSENIDPANGDLNWTFKTNDAAHTFEAFGNTSASIVDNPVVDDVNSSCNVEEFVKASGCETWSGLGTELATALDFTSASTNKVFKMKVLAKNQVADVTLRLERLPYPDTDPAVERVASVTEVGAWQELTFDFSDVSSGTYKSLILYFERNASCDGDLYYFDDLNQVEGDTGGGGVCTVDAAQSLSAANFNMTMATDPSASVISDGAGFEWIDNPDFDNALNSSCKVGKITKSGQFAWDNNQIDLDAKLDFDVNAGFKIKVWSARANTEVRIKLEEIGNAGNNVEKFTTTTVTSGWQELTIPFEATNSGKFNKIVIFLDLNANNTDTYYFDDLKLYERSTGGTGGCAGTPIAATAFPVNFESCESFLSTFTDAGSITTELADNPAKTGINTSDFVLKVVKAAGTNRWAGFQNAFPSNFDATKTFKVKVYSSKANVVMKFEVNSDPQSPDSGNPGPQYATIAAANTWTEVQIIFTGIPPNNTGLNQFVIKPDNPAGTDGETTSSEGIYYFDDIRLE